MHKTEQPRTQDLFFARYFRCASEEKSLGTRLKTRLSTPLLASLISIHGASAKLYFVCRDGYQ